MPGPMTIALHSSDFDDRDGADGEVALGENAAGRWAVWQLG
jgi:hypothetical protein